MSPIVEAHIFYSGRVQGVGFRYTAHCYAAALALQGWVKNLPDGRVEILLEGTEEVIRKFCRNIEHHFPEGCVKDKTMDIAPAHGKFSDFQIF